jgi:hypothetical protein
MLFKNPVRTSKRTPHFTITKISWLTLFKELIAVYSEDNSRSINAKCIVTDWQSRWYRYFPLGFEGLFLTTACRELLVIAVRYSRD